MKRILILCSLFLSLLALASCGRKEEKKTLKEGQIWLYYLNSTEDGFEKVAHTLVSPEDPEKSVAEVLYELSDTEGDNTSEYKAFMQGVTVQKTVFSKGNVSIDFGEDYHNIGKTDEGLYRAAIVKSLVQIDGVKTVKFSVNGIDLMGSDETPVGILDGESFLIEGEQDIYHVDRTVTLYYANAEGSRLVPVKKHLSSDSNVPVEQLALQQLTKKPKGKGEEDLINPLPKNLSINRVEIFDNLCYVDLGEDILQVAPGVSETITVYSMVHTLCALNPAYQIHFTVEGERVSQLNNLEHFDSTFYVHPEYNEE